MPTAARTSEKTDPCTLPSIEDIRSVAAPTLLLSALVCSAFAASASLVLLVALYAGVFTEPPPFALRTGLKVIFFTLLTCALGAAFWRKGRQKQPKFTDQPIADRRLAALLALPLALFCVWWGFWNLSKYPDVFPDEWHHLIVARNIAKFGEYASGLPPEHIKPFDWYDSVGPTAILPTAAALRVDDYSFDQGRVPVVISYLLLSGLVYWSVFRCFGAWHAVSATLLLALAPGTPFLARSLYGEVPGFLYFLGGLLLWGYSASLQKPSGNICAVAAGILLGMAALTKLFLFVGFWALIGAWIYDRRIGGRMRWAHLLLPALGVLIPYFAWMLYSTAQGADSGTSIFKLSFYRHKLMFGLDTILFGFNGILGNWHRILAGAIALAAVAPFVFKRRYSPGWVAIYLSAPLFLFWWLFFTPGTISRYSWYGTAAIAIFAGIFLGCAHYTFYAKSGSMTRIVVLLLVLLTVFPYALSLRHHGERILFHDQTAEFLELGDYFLQVPYESSIGTLYYPAERSLNFMQERYVVEATDLETALKQYDYVIAYSEHNGELPLGTQGVSVVPIGRFRVYSAE